MTRKWFELQLSSHFWSELFSFNLHLSTFHFISIIFNRVDEMKKVLPTFTSGRTTASMVFVTKDNYIFVNYGDSRSVLYDEKGMRFETKDHSPVVSFIKRLETDNFIALATDGIWDSLSPEQPTNDTLFNFIKERFRDQPLSSVCEEVVDFSMKEDCPSRGLGNRSIILYDCQRSHKLRGIMKQGVTTWY